MGQAFRRWWLGCGGIALLAAAASAQQSPTYSLKAVKRNGIAITPSNSISANPGDTIEAEVFLSGWSPAGQRLKAWQVTIDNLTGFSSGPRGSFDFVQGTRSCTNDDGCDDLGVFCCDDTIAPCNAPPTVCQTTEPRARGAFMDEDRADFVYDEEAATPHIFATRLRDPKSGPAPAFGATALLGYPLYNPAGTGSPPVETSPKYCGTIIIRSTSNACGSFTIPFAVGPGTFMFDQDNQLIPIARLDALSVNLGVCACTTIVASNPPNCFIDPRQPSEPDGSQLAGPQSIDLQLDVCDASTLTCGAFEVSQSPSGPPAIGCNSITPNIVPGDPSWIRLNLSRRISTQRWTCVAFAAEGTLHCISHLPADVDIDGEVDPRFDFERLLGCLDANPPCTLRECDLDRSGFCGPKDLIREADLQNGGDSYVVWRGLAVPSACPSP